MNSSNFQTIHDEMESSFPSIVTSSDAFVAIDYDFCFLYVNRQAEKFYKRKSDALVGQKIEEIFPEQWEFGPFKNARQSVEAKKYVEINYHSPFTKSWVQLIGRPFENYYTFTYRMIDHKDVLTKELRKEVGKSNKGRGI